MFSFRQIFRLGSQLALARQSVNLHQISLISRENFGLNVHKKIFVRTKTDVCESPQQNNEEASNKKVLGKLEGKMKLMFTCKRCDYRNSKIISKVAYEKGLVIVRCDYCKNNHLIADNLGWFDELRKMNNIEKFLAAKGESVRKVLNDVDGYIEAVAKAELDLLEHNRNRERSIEKEKSEEVIQEKKAETSEDK